MFLAVVLEVRRRMHSAGGVMRSKASKLGFTATRSIGGTSNNSQRKLL